MNITIFLTGCVNPNGMVFTKLQNQEVRLHQYETAIKWYIMNTDYNVVFVDNSQFDLSYLIKDLNTQRLEVLWFDGNNFEKTLGKGFGEGKIIEYALSHSKFLREDSYIIKITGRLILKNINSICKQYESNNKNNVILCDFNRNLSVAFSRVFIAPYLFYKNYLTNEVKNCNDSKHFEFEHALANAIKKSIVTKSCTVMPFSCPYILQGISGTDGTIIKNKNALTILMKKILFTIGVWGRF